MSYRKPVEARTAAAESKTSPADIDVVPLVDATGKLKKLTWLNLKTEAGITDATAIGRSLITAADAATARTAIGLTTVSAKDFSAVGDGIANNSTALTAANAAAAAATLPLLITPGTYLINSDVTFSAVVKLLPGAILKPASGVTVKFNAGITTDGLYRVFDHSLGGKCVPLKVSYYHPAWWGSTGTSDDSQTWKDMMLAAQAYSAWQNYGQQRVMVPQGVNRLWEVALSNVHLEGNGRSSLIGPPSTATPGDPVGSNTGYVVKFGGTTTVSGCEFTSGSIAGITVIAWAGSQVNMVQSHVSISGADTIGIYVYGSGLGMRLVDCIIAQGTGEEGQPTNGIGIKGVGTAYDAKLTNVIIWGCETGISLSTTSWYLTNVHIYGCDYGIDGSTSNSKFTGCLFDKNYKWGVRLDSTDNTVFDSTTWFYRNGADGGGGLAFSSNAVANRTKGNRVDAVFDDNHAYGLYLNNAAQTSGDLRITSGLALNSLTPLTTTGVYVDSGSSSCEMRVLPSLTWPVTGPLVNNLNSTSIVTSRATPETRATSGTTTTLSVDSTTVQVFTGSADQTVTLPTTGVGVGQQWTISNHTTANALDVKSSDGTSFFTVYTGHSATFRARNYSPSIPAHWAVSSSTAPNSIQLGHASDTTLTRSAAGILAVEGVDQVNLSSSQTLTSKTLTTPTLTTPVINGTSSGTGVAVANTGSAYSPSTLVQRDSNGMVHASAYFPGRTQISTNGGGSTTMNSGYSQVLDLYGTGTWTVLLPTTGIYAGMQYTIVNRSSGDVTVQSSGANNVATLAGSGSPSAKLFIALKDTPTAAADWRAI